MFTNDEDMAIKTLLAYIEAMIPTIIKYGFTCRRSNNLLEFTAQDGRRMCLRSYTNANKVSGVRLSIKVTARLEVQIMDIDDISDVVALMLTMKKFAEGIKGERCKPLHREG